MTRALNIANIADQLLGTPGLLLTVDNAGNIVTLAPPPGVTGYVLTTDSDNAYGIKWDASGGGGSLPTFTASQLVVTDSAGALVSVGSPTLAELAFLGGVTSALQTQIDGKAATSHSHAIANVTNLQATLDAKAPIATGAGTSKYYGTDASGAAGYYALPGGAASGDMLKSIYDTNNDGIVDVAAVANAVAWTGVTGKPTAFATNIASFADSFNKGDLLYAAATGASATLSKRAIGSAGQVLAVGATGIPEWQTFSSALPSQTGNNNKWLTTNGTTAFWDSTLRTGDTSWIAAATHAGWSNITGDYFKVLSVGDTSQSAAGCFITRTSNASNEGAAVWTTSLVSVSDSPGSRGAYALYTESWKKSTSLAANTVHGWECHVSNEHSYVSPQNIYSPNDSGLTEGIRITTWALGARTTYNASTAISILGDIGGSYGGPGWLRGIMFGQNSCVGGRAIEMPALYSINWAVQSGATALQGPQIRSDCTTASAGMKMIFVANSISFQSYSGSNVFWFNDDGTLYINKTTAGTAGAIAEYLPVVINGVARKIALLAS